MAGSALLVSRRSLADLLHAFRLRRGEGHGVVETRLREATRRLASPDTGDVADILHKPAPIAALERRSPGSLRLSATDWRLLAEAYAIPRLMLDPLRVETRDTVCLFQRWDELQPLVFESDSEYGVGAEYFAPAAKRLETEETAFVLLKLGRGGRSQTHAHPGDELLFVLDGAVEVLLETTGLSVRLEAGDHLHFYAEQRHGVVNRGDGVARVFVIRFYQLGRAGTRTELLQRLRDSLQDSDQQVTARAIREMIAVLTPTELREEGLTEGEVRDRGGLGRLLQLLCTPRFRGVLGPLPVREVARLLQVQGLPYTTPKVDRMHHGNAPVPAEHLAALAGVYGAEPLLLYEFLYPALRPAIAVRSDIDYRDVPASILAPSSAQYLVPCRRLADSNLGVARLMLPPNTATPPNRHPGHELLIPRRGRAHIQIDDLSRPIDPNEVLFVHYTSEHTHQVANKGLEPVDLLGVRFYE